MGASMGDEEGVERRPLVFALNGERVELACVDPSTTLLSYLRAESPFKGTKRGCGEGGCGACVVMLSSYNPETKEVKERTVTSCLVLLCSIDGCAITTTEGLGNQRDGLHSIHKRLSAFHGSQCGFCTPGMTMAIYGCLKKEQQKTSTLASKHTVPLTPDGGCNNHHLAASGPTSETLEKAVLGHICRCTGYRSILDTCKSFASDVDLEDLGLNSCWSGASQAKQENLPVYDPSADPKFPRFLMEELEARISQSRGDSEEAVRFKHVVGSCKGKKGERGREWVSASSLAHALEALNLLKQSFSMKQVKLVVGNTSSGIYKDMKPQVYVDISKIPELLEVSRSYDGVEVGAATPIAELIEVLEEFVTIGKEPAIAQGLADHLKQLAAGHVRNWGSVGGNLVMAQQFGFESDLATILLGAGASVKVVTSMGQQQQAQKTSVLSLEEFLAKGAQHGDECSILQSIDIPLHFASSPTSSTNGTQNGTHNGIKKPSSTSSTNSSNLKTVFKSFRGAPRPFGNAVSYTNAAFLARVSSGSYGVVIEDVRLAFGAFGTKHAIRALEVEQMLKGKPLSASLVLDAIELLKKEIVPLQGTTKREFRVSLAVGFLFEFLNPLVSKEPFVTPASLVPHVGKQNITLSDEHFPVSQPVPKFLSQIQASGEAQYVDDIPSPPRCLYAAFVLSSEPYAKIKGQDTQVAIESEGVVAYLSAQDIPQSGVNVGCMSFTGDMEPLFAADVAYYVGEPVGLVVADTYDNARLAAGKVKVDYDTHNLEDPVMTCEDAIAKNSLHPQKPPFEPERVGNVEESLQKAEFNLEGEVRSNSQNHFYMETQTALAIPDEDGCMNVYTSCQAPDLVQMLISMCLNLPLHNIRVITRRLGGAFGGKVLQNLKISCAVAVAAYKLRRPVRISLDRNTDMQMIGGRTPTKTKFRVGFTKTGKITGLKAEILIEGGWYLNGCAFNTRTIDSSLRKYNYGSIDVKMTLCKTNNVPKTFVRAPGDVQGTYIADCIVGQVASYLGMSSDQVRDANFHTAETLSLFHGKELGDDDGYTLAQMWNKLKVSAKKVEREKEVEEFNAQNKWLKRGLAMVPSVYGVFVKGSMATVSIFQDGSIIVEIAGVEMGQGLYTKVRQTVAYALSSLWTKEQSMDMLDKIRVLQSDTHSLPNTRVDGGSTTSEGACQAALQACAVLVERLLPIKESLTKAEPDGKVPWPTLCLKARNMGIDLQSHERWSPPWSSYFIYGAALSEVEINTLTGATRILAADIIHDSGKSLNPAVDIGQVEGCFVFGIGFFLTEEIVRDSKGKIVSDGTWTYKPPTMDIIPQRFNVELFNSPVHKKRILSSKASGEPPLLLASSVFSAIRSAITAARKDYYGGTLEHDTFQFDQPATMDKVKKLCGFDNVERHLQSLATTAAAAAAAPTHHNGKVA